MVRSTPRGVVTPSCLFAYRRSATIKLSLPSAPPLVRPLPVCLCSPGEEEGGFSLFLLPYLRPPLSLFLSVPPSLPPAGVRTVATCVSSLSLFLSPSLSLSRGRSTIRACLPSNCYSQHSEYNVPFGSFRLSTTRYPTTNERACVRECVNACVHTYVRIRTVRAAVRPSVRACVRAFVPACVCVSVCACVYVRERHAARNESGGRENAPRAARNRVWRFRRVTAVTVTRVSECVREG